ncbi:hypothetical protein EPN29_11045 [bacterium]|nr:MAG: hypothetical protein EPN29_11045 [bacterium]
MMATTSRDMGGAAQIRERVPWYSTVTYDFKLWRVDLKTIVASVLWGIVVAVMLNIAERLDSAIFGGTFFLFGAATQALAVGPALFGLPGGWITLVISPLFSTLTATTPLAPIFFFTNSLYAIGTAVGTYMVKREGKGLTILQLYLANAVGSLLITLPYPLFIWPVLVGMTPNLVFKTGLILFLEFALGLPILSFVVMKRALATRLWP